MKTTRNLLAGELMILSRQLKYQKSLSRLYSKKFYDKHFVKALGRDLLYHNHGKDINVTETDDDYILEVTE